MVRISPDEFRALGRPRPPAYTAATTILGEPGPRRLEVFVSGELRNYANRHASSWKPEAAYKKRWHKAVERTLGVVMGAVRWSWPSTIPKHVRLFAHVHNLMDPRDGLPNALKPVVDELVDLGILHGDDAEALAPSPGGHELVYEQAIERGRRGVTLTISVPARGAAAPATEDR